MSQQSNVDSVLNNFKSISTSCAASMKRLEQMAAHYANNFPERLTDEKAEQFKTNFAQVIADERKRDQQVKAMEEVKTKYRNKEKIDFAETFERRVRDLAPKGSETDDNRYRNFCQQLRTIKSGAAAGGMSSEEAEDSEAEAQQADVRDLSDNEDMLMVDEEPRRLVCPITKREMEDPVKNRFCGHLYEREAILQHIVQCGPNPPKCPTMGCGNKHRVRKEHLMEAEELQKQPRPH